MIIFANQQSLCCSHHGLEILSFRREDVLWRIKQQNGSRGTSPRHCSSLFHKFLLSIVCERKIKRAKREIQLIFMCKHVIYAISIIRLGLLFSVSLKIVKEGMWRDYSLITFCGFQINKRKFFMIYILRSTTLLRRRAGEMMFETQEWK